MIREWSDSRSELIEMAKNICAETGRTMFVYWFPRAIPRRGAVVDADGAAEYLNQPWASLVFTAQLTAEE